MRMTRCFIGLATALMVAASAHAFAVTGERVAVSEDYPSHMQAMPAVVAGVEVNLQERMCSQSADMPADAVPHTVNLAVCAASASVGVTLPAMADISAVATS